MSTFNAQAEAFRIAEECHKGATDRDCWDMCHEAARKTGGKLTAEQFYKMSDNQYRQHFERQ